MLFLQNMLGNLIYEVFPSYLAGSLLVKQPFPKPILYSLKRNILKQLLLPIYLFILLEFL